MADRRRLAAIMFTDMVGFTAAAQRHEAEALELLREQEQLVRPIVRSHGGREIKSTGDGLPIEFSSALHAAECAVEVQTRFHERSARGDRSPIQLRIGLHVGDVEERNSDIFGDAVNVAARVLSVAEPEGIALTEQVAHHLENKLAWPVEGLGPRGLKGVDRPIPVFRIVLPWSGPVPLAKPEAYHRVAILPLRNISPDPNDEYFADGLTEELHTVLGQVRELRVIAQSSVARFRGQDRPLPEIGHALGATAVLEGSVRKSGDRLRISLQLVDVVTQEGLWAQTFYRQLTDIFAVQAEVGERTATSLRIRLMGAERAALSRPPTTNLSAYGLYLQGLHRIHRPSSEDDETAADLFRRAIAEDPSFAAAYYQCAHCLLGSIGERNPAREVVPEARRMIEKALALDPLSSEAHAAKGNLAMQADLDWGIAEAEFRRAVELNPSDAEARIWYGILLRALQRYSEAIEQCRTVVELDPLNASAHAFLVGLMRLSWNLDEAERLTRSALKRFLDSSAFRVTLAYTLAYGGRRADALHELQSATDLTDPTVASDVAILSARLGDPKQARARLEELEKSAPPRTYVPILQFAALAASVGDADKAMAYLEKDWAEGDRGLWYVYQGVAFDPLRSDARFHRMLERMHLPTSAPFYRHGRAT